MIGLIRSPGLPVTFVNRDGGVAEAIVDLRVPMPTRRLIASQEERSAPASLRDAGAAPVASAAV